MTDNMVLDMVRDTARRSNKSQAAVAAELKRDGFLNRYYLSTINIGLTREDYGYAKRILTRLAKFSN